MGTELFQSSTFFGVRLAERQGTVVVDTRARAIVELAEPAAMALDVLLDRVTLAPPRPPGDPILYPRARAAMSAVIDALERADELPAGAAVTLDDTWGDFLLRRRAAPAPWRDAPPDASGICVALDLVDTTAGALLIGGLAGPARREIAGALRAMRLGGVRPAVLAFDETAQRTRAIARVEGEPFEAREIWLLQGASAGQLVMTRLAAAAAIVGVLELAARQPTPEGLLALARSVENTPIFGAVTPSERSPLASSLRSYLGVGKK